MRQEPNIQHILERMPKDVADSFTEKQLAHINTALAGRHWGNHKLDLRGTISLWKNRYYFVFLAGKDKRDYSRAQTRVGRFIVAVFTTAFFTISIALGLLVLYLLKSWLGINLFEDFSLGLWDWFKENN